MEAGKNYGVRNAGYYALRALRTEKFFAYWGTDLTPFVTPLECGREYRVKFDVSFSWSRLGIIIVIAFTPDMELVNLELELFFATKITKSTN